MIRRGLPALLLVVTVDLSGASAFDGDETFRRGAYVLSLEAGGGAQANFEHKRDDTDLTFWNTGVRFSLLPWGPVGPGVLHGALEVGLEPFVQRYTDPVRAHFVGLAAVGRYHFLSLGRVVPYLEMLFSAGDTNLRVREIDSDFTFLVQAGLGASFFLTDHLAIYGGYRLQHVSNGNTSSPNRGFESHTGVAGMSFYFP